MMDSDIFETYDRLARLLEETTQQIERMAQAAAKMFPAAAAGPTKGPGRIPGAGAPGRYADRGAPYTGTERTTDATNAAGGGGV
ncbi:MAG: hypothetical protein J7M19_02675, partial [Planctomycetes bacterium]|nr:hypothetical protein [Planctomycetota bacterium]